MSVIPHRPDLIGLGVDLDDRQGRVMDHVALTDAAGIAYRLHLLASPRRCGSPSARAAPETKVRLVAARAPPKAPNMGR